jgi:hypothetical protein
MGHQEISILTSPCKTITHHYRCPNQQQYHLPHSTKPTQKHKATVPLPYHQGTSDIITRAMCKADICTYLVSTGSLRQHMVHLKNRLSPLTKSAVVYHAPCAGKLDQPCDAKYIGKTERSMDIRFCKHHNKACLTNTDTYASAIGQHARETGHHFRPSDIIYLNSDSKGLARGIKEAIYTRALDPILNRGGSLRYDRLITSTIRPPKNSPLCTPNSTPPPTTSPNLEC